MDVLQPCHNAQMKEFQFHLPTLAISLVFGLFSMTLFLLLGPPEKYLSLFILALSLLTLQFSFAVITLTDKTFSVKEGFLRRHNIYICRKSAVTAVRSCTRMERSLQVAKRRYLWGESRFCGLGRKVIVFDGNSEYEFRIAVNKPDIFLKQLS